MQQYKVDWIAFTIDFRQNGDQRWFDEKIFEVLRFNLSEFEECNGRYFYNSGITCHEFFNAYWNNPDKNMSPKTTKTMKQSMSTTRVSNLQGLTSLLMITLRQFPSRKSKIN